ncbi:DNA-3-methyladenine glycosylase 2 family protein [Streptomyces sp. NPDC060194]|uniref:DNA-3-methyladenine glycosylase 2 family protein n=1 Tax=Streptomyces sp. NPDC060194 TaxID=3347069 RepID=UPI0036546443
MNEDSKYEAVTSRDARFDGEFLFAVTTTGIYCRPSCPATTPLRTNTRFFPTSAAAQAHGFRACRRCRPDAVPGSAAWDVRADAVARAVRMIGDGVVDREGVPGLAARLGYSTRQVQRQLTAELGAGPVALARAQRAQTARILLRTTGLRATDIAFAAGFASVRQFNDTVRAVYAATPTQLRDGAGPPPPASGGIPLRLAFRGPYAAGQVFDHLDRRAVPGVEELTGRPGARTYRRTLRLPHGTAVAEADERARRGRGGGSGWLDCRLHLTDLRDLTTATRRVRRLLDLDADPCSVAEHLGADPLLAPLVAATPGLRSPGAADPDELAVRALLARGTTPDEARARAAVLVTAHGDPLPAPDGALTHLFPTPEALAATAPTTAPDPADPGDAVRELAAALAEGRVRLDPGTDRDRTEKDLLTLRHMDARTAALIRMRALGDPDVLPDPHLPRQLGADPTTPADWRPWRSYAQHHLWNHFRTAPSPTGGDHP